MKELKSKWVKAFMVLLVFTTTFNISCKKDDNDEVVEEQGSDYVGTWKSDIMVSSENGDYKDVLTLTKNSFNDIIQMQTSNNQWVNSFSLKGSMTVNGNLMNVHVSEIGVSAIDPVSGEFTGSITTYQEGSLFFEVLIAQTEQDKDFQSEYAVDGNKLTLKTDLNNDGDYTDSNEIVVYTRQ